MNIQTFLEHHGIVRNPFAEEDAQTDQVFKEYCISSAYHPIWDKVYGDPKDPSTAIIFGPKGSGKTAMRLQVDQHLQKYNQDNPNERICIIRYDDFNPFLDHFCERMSRRTTKKPERVLDAWRLWDHMDAILCLGVTKLVDNILGTKNDMQLDPEAVHKLDRTAARDLLLLASSYDQSTDASFLNRWEDARKKLRFGNLSSKLSCWFAWAWGALVVLLFAMLFLRPAAPVTAPEAESVLNAAVQTTHFVTMLQDAAEPPPPPPRGGFMGWFNSVFGNHRPSLSWLWLAPILILAGAMPCLIRCLKCHLMAMGIRRYMRVGNREIGPIRKVLQRIPAKELTSQPLPRFDRTDDRYELLRKFQAVLEQLGYRGTVVLMDRVDEPHLTGGKPELMRRFVWPLLDNKLLKHPGLGFKMMLPQELHRDMERESREFHERARLDKQNVIPSFSWSGEALYDLVRSRIIACSKEGTTPSEPKDLFAEDFDYQRLINAFKTLRVPRHLFRFLYRVLVDHCSRHTDADPSFKIGPETFETVYAVYSREANPDYT